MGKKSRNKKQRGHAVAEPRPATAPQQAVSRFVSRLAVPATQPTLKAFWDWFDELYGESAYRLSDVMDGKIHDNKFGARAETLRMSIDHQFGLSGDLVRAVMKAVARRLNGRQVRTIAEIGCGNGIHGCFGAWLCDASLTAFDIDERNIRAARELATRVGIEHDIVQSDMLHDEWPVADEDADVVLSIASVAAIGVPLRESSAVELTHILKQVRRVISPDGLYIAFERLPDPERCHEFTETAANCGHALDLDASERLAVQEAPEKVEFIPFLVFSASQAAQAPSVSELRGLAGRP